MSTDILRQRVEFVNSLSENHRISGDSFKNIGIKKRLDTGDPEAHGRACKRENPERKRGWLSSSDMRTYFLAKANEE